MMNKKGFTLIEVLVTIVIISLVSGIGVISYQTFFRTGEDRYYDALESDVLLAGSDYFIDHRDQLPTGNEVNYVSLSDLIDNKYIEPVKDSDGNICTEGKVYAYRENNKFKYEACIINCGGHTSKGKYCDETAPSNVINISAIVLGSNPTRTYDVSKTYNSVEYLKNNEVVRVTFSMSNTKAVYYEVINTTTTTNTLHCSRGTGTSCYVDVNKSGTYKVTAYDSANPSTRKVVATNQYFSVRITTQGPQFTITGASKTLMSKTESACNGNVNAKPTKSVTYTIVKSNINEEYKKVEYKITGNQYNVNNGNYKENTNANKLVITESLPSGKYTLDVKITNFAGEESVETKTFDISFYIDTKFSDNDYAGLDNKHEVVAGQKYDYIKTLPTYKVAYTKNMEIRWHLSTEEFDESRRIFGSSIVPRSCTYEINGLMAIPVELPTTALCAATTPVYNGQKQVLTEDAPEGVAFTNNEQINAGEYTITAKIDEPNYIWKSAWDFNDKTFKCSMNKAANSITLTCNNIKYTGSNQTLLSAKSAKGGTVYIASSALTVDNYSSVGGTELSKVQGKNANNYSVYAYTPGDNNYYSASGSRICTIGKADNIVKITEKKYSYDGKGHATTVSVTNGTPSVTYYSDSSCRTKTTTTNATAAGGTPKQAGTYYATASVPASDNYEAGSASCTKAVVIDKVYASLSCSDKRYNGSTQTGCSCSGGTVGGTYSAANAGSYTASCTGDVNHNNPSNKTWKITGGVTYATYTGTSTSGSASVTVSGATGLTSYSASTGSASCSIDRGTITCSISNVGSRTAANRSECITLNQGIINLYGGDPNMIIYYSGNSAKPCYQGAGNSKITSNSSSSGAVPLIGTCGTFFTEWGSNHCNNSCKSVSTDDCASGVSAGTVSHQYTSNGSVKTSWYCRCVEPAANQSIYSSTVTIYYY